MNVEDVMALPAKRRPARLDAAQYALAREKKTGDLVGASVLKAIGDLDVLRGQVATAPESLTEVMNGAYENACTRFGGVGSIHALESEGGIEAVHDLTRRLLAD